MRHRFKNLTVQTCLYIYIYIYIITGAALRNYSRTYSGEISAGYTRCCTTVDIPALKFI